MESDSRSATSSSEERPCKRCFGVSSAMTASEECENAVCPQFGLQPEEWPPQGTMTPCDPCDELNTCPNPNDYFLIPPRPNWYGEVGGAAICRNPSRGVIFASLANTTVLDAPPYLLSTSGITYDFMATGRFLVGVTIDDYFQVEGSYFMLADDQNSAGMADPDGEILSPFSVVADTGLNFAQINYTSSLHGAELNLRRKVPMSDRLSLSTLLGVRYLGLPEQFDFFGRPPAGATTSIHSRTTNEMVGPQIGARAELNTDDRWWITTEIKAAVLNNRTTQTISGDFASSAKGSHTAFAGDLSLKFVYRWTPNMAMHVGYQALWLEGLTLAPENIEANFDFIRQQPAGFSQLKHNSGSVYHGPIVGLEVGW